MRRDLVLEDTTLRDGEQAPGVAFSKEVKLRIHDALVDCGVRWIEAGIPAMGGDELDFLRALLARGSDARLVAWNRGVRADVTLSLDIGFDAVHIGLPASDKHLSNSVQRDTKWLLATARDLIGYAKDRGAFVSVSAEDVARADTGFLQEYAHAVREAGADRLRLSDTVGLLSPEAYADKVRAVTSVTDIDVQCHPHNDFGLAVANTLAGLQAGARYFHVTVNAMGERAGMPDFAQVVCALRYLYGADVGIDLTKLRSLSRVVAAATRRPTPPWQPIVGDNVFAHESGIHVNAMLRSVDTFEPIAPEDVGGVRRYVVGKHSGRALLKQILERRGFDPGDDELSACLDAVRTEATRTGGAVPDDVVVELYRRTGTGPAPVAVSTPVERR